MWISDSTKKGLDLLVQNMFMLNRIWDRGLSELGVKFAMSKFDSIYHPNIAHSFPLLADVFSGVQGKFNVTTAYLQTPEDITEYKNPIEFFERNLMEHKKSYELLKEVIVIAVDNGDINAEVALKDFLKGFNNFIAQAILLRDKSVAYKCDGTDTFMVQMFDANCDQFLIL